MKTIILTILTFLIALSAQAYIKNLKLDDATSDKYSLKHALEELQSSEGDFTALNKNDVKTLKRWHQNREIKSLIKIESKNSSAYIFVSKDKTNFLLVVTRTTYHD